MSRQIEGKTIFASLLTKRPRYYTDPGSHEAEIYEMTIDKKGHKALVCTGTKDIWEEMQSYKDECDIKQIVARAAAGDYEALNQRQGYYGDITDTPATLAEAQNAIIKLSNEFDSLPPEIRAKFDNSKEVFVSQYGTEQWAESMGLKENEAEKAEKVDFIPGTNPANTKILTPEEQA